MESFDPLWTTLIKQMRKDRDNWRSMAERLAEALKKADKRVWEHHEIGYLSRAFRALADCELCTDRRFYETEEALAAFEKMKGESRG